MHFICLILLSATLTVCQFAFAAMRLFPLQTRAPLSSARVLVRHVPARELPFLGVIGFRQWRKAYVSDAKCRRVALRAPPPRRTHSPYSLVPRFHQVTIVSRRLLPARFPDRIDLPSPTTSGREEFAAVVKVAAATKRRRRAARRKDAITKSAKLSNAEHKLKNLQDERKTILGKLASALAWQSTAKKNIERLQSELDAAHAELEKLRLSAAADRAAHALDLHGRIDQNTELLNEAHRRQKEHIARLQHENRLEKAQLKQDLTRALGAEKRYRHQRDELRREKEQSAALIASLQCQLQRATFPACLP